MEWLENAKLNPDETVKLADSLNYYQTKADTGKWLDWLASKKTENATQNLMRNWTQNDYKAAGEWLAQSPAGPTKEAATISYLETVASYDPEVAAQWAQTLPEAKQKGAMSNIHSQLERKDKAAAEDFAKRHGIADP